MTLTLCINVDELLSITGKQIRQVYFVLDYGLAVCHADVVVFDVLFNWKSYELCLECACSCHIATSAACPDHIETVP